MEIVGGLFLLLSMLIIFFTGLFLFAVQPIWSMVDIAESRRLTGGVKAVLIVLTIVLLWSLLTFFYALFGSESRALRQWTKVNGAIFAVGLAAFIGLSAVGAAIGDGELPEATDAVAVEGDPAAADAGVRASDVATAELEIEASATR